VSGDFVAVGSTVFAAGGCGAPLCAALWRGQRGGGPAIADGVLYSTNSSTAHVEATVAFAAEPVVVDGRVFVALDEGTLAVFGLPAPG
jgi:hypothetical protein